LLRNGEFKYSTIILTTSIVSMTNPTTRCDCWLGQLHYIHQLGSLIVSSDLIETIKTFADQGVSSSSYVSLIYYWIWHLSRVLLDYLEK